MLASSSKTARLKIDFTGTSSASACIGTAASKTRITTGGKSKFPTAPTGSNTCSTSPLMRTPESAAYKIIFLSSSRKLKPQWPSSKPTVSRPPTPPKSAATANGRSTSTIPISLASNLWSSSRLRSHAAIPTPLSTLNHDRSLVEHSLFLPRVSRPVGLHHRPLAEPDVNLSAHPAPIKQTSQSNGLSVARIEVLLLPVASVMRPLDPTPSLQLHYEPSSLIRVGPPQCSASVRSPRGFGRLGFSLRIRATGSCSSTR